MNPKSNSKHARMAIVNPGTSQITDLSKVTCYAQYAGHLAGRKCATEWMCDGVRRLTYMSSQSHKNITSPVISLPSYVLSTGSESLNASNTSSSHSPTKFSQLANSIPSQPHLCSTSSQYLFFILRYSCSATEIILTKNN